jgi:excisionase family DNA binding protein
MTRASSSPFSAPTLSSEMPPSVADGSSVGNALLPTPEQAAHQLSVERTTIYTLMASGELPPVNIGRYRRVPVSSLSLFVTRLIGDIDAVQPRSTSQRQTVVVNKGSDCEALHVRPSRKHG